MSLGVTAFGMMHPALMLSASALAVEAVPRFGVPSPNAELTKEVLGNVGFFGVASVSAPSAVAGFELDRVLRAYRERRFVLSSESHGTVIREGGRELDDCALVERLGMPVHPRLAARCGSNDLEWSYALIPAGVLVGGAGVLSGDSETSELLLVSGVGAALLGLVVGGLLNRDGLASGEHVLDGAALRSMVDEANARFAAALGLCEADLEIGEKLEEP